MPTKKSSSSPKKRQSAKPEVVNQRVTPSVEIGGDANNSNFVIGDNNNVTNDNSQTTVVNAEIQTTVNLTNEGNAPISINTDDISVITKNSSRQLILYGLFVVFLTGIGLAFFNYVWFRFERMVASGEFNVLVIPFVEERPWGYVNTDLGWEVAQIFTEGTKNAFENSGSDINLKIFGPSDKVPQMIYLFSENQLDREAEKISEKVNGQIVIYGVISEDKYGDKIITTKIYISPTNFGEAQELISDSMMGELSLGSIRLTGNTVSGGDLLAQNKELRDRLEIFSNIINFLGAYVGEDFDRADEYISRAGNEDFWSNASGLEVVYLIHGNMQIRQARVAMVNKDLEQSLEIMEQAKQNFEKANDVSVENGNGDYVRAYLGLAGVEGLLAIVEANINRDPNLIDIAALERSMKYFDKAQNAKYQPETADVMVKVNYGRAQAALAYFAKTSNVQYLEEARINYQQVVDEYDNTNNERISEFAALSYSGLGLIARQNGEYDVAIEHFLSAYEITANPSLRVQCLINIGDIYYGINDYENAINYYEDALSRKRELLTAVPIEKIEEIENRIKLMKQGDNL